MKKYINPTVEICCLYEEDVIRTSNTYHDNELPVVPFTGTTTTDMFEE